MVRHVSIMRGVTSASAQPAMRERIAREVNITVTNRVQNVNVCEVVVTAIVLVSKSGSRSQSNVSQGNRQKHLYSPYQIPAFQIIYNMDCIRLSVHIKFKVE